jgi:hypothetical protein
MSNQTGFMAYMRAHGNTPNPTQRPNVTGALASAIASIPSALILLFTGALYSVSLSLKISFWLLLPLYTSLMVMAGALYGQIFSRAANELRGGWLFGMSYGFLLWVIGPVTILQLVTGRPHAVGTAAIGLFGANIVFGLLLGALFPLIHKMVQRKLIL